MLLYHGSNIAVEKPQLMPIKRQLDFGAGFYLTSNLEQARKWAVRKVNIRMEGIATVSVFSFAEECFQSLKILRFKGPDREWLEFVVANRTGKTISDDYDIICGPVANDQTVRTINDYINGYLTADIALQLLLPQKLKDQYAFKTAESLTALQFKETLS